MNEFSSTEFYNKHITYKVLQVYFTIGKNIIFF